MFKTLLCLRFINEINLNEISLMQFVLSLSTVVWCKWIAKCFVIHLKNVTITVIFLERNHTSQEEMKNIVGIYIRYYCQDKLFIQ